MARHRHVKNLDYDEEYDQAFDDSVYGRSFEDSEFGVSPSTDGYLFNKNKESCGFGNYFASQDIQEEDEDLDRESENQDENRKGAQNYERPRLSSENEIRLNSILDSLRDVVGEMFSESVMIRTVLNSNYDQEASLDALFKLDDAASKPANIPKAPKKSKKKPTGTKRLSGPSQTTPVIVQVPTRPVVTGFQPPVTKEPRFEAVAAASIPSTPERNKNVIIAEITAKLRDKTVNIEKKFEEARSTGQKSLLNLVVVGHVDSGKSTLMGHMLYIQGLVSQRAMHKYEKESKQMNRQSFMFAWVLDETEEERSRGVTVDIAQRSFETETKKITLLDAPGHRDFIPNMITGAARADVAVLVVDATRGCFESGFQSGGQTREHAILVRSLGLAQLAVAVNKMDTVDWDQTRFTEIQDALKHFLKSVGFRDKDVVFIPCSGLMGDNLCSPSKSDLLTSWYKGPTLLQSIDDLKTPEREITRPVRFCISNVFKATGSNMWVAGKLQTGYMQNGDRLLLLPQAEVATVKGIQNENGDLGYAFAGDHVDVTVSGVDPSVLHIGDFLCDPQRPVKLAIKIQARVVLFNVAQPIIKGTAVKFHYLSVSESATVCRLISLINKSTGEVVKQRPRALTKNVSAIIELEFLRPLCLEVFHEFKDLGRFMLRRQSGTVAVGMVTEIMA